mmetsp:Transcript_46459/g.99538  ORF Transcript_46459/g.99538 Transcript_46459/m.99538 type:complete len:383 (-) Transcript_46459:297-1445(-)
MAQIRLQLRDIGCQSSDCRLSLAHLPAQVLDVLLMLFLLLLGLRHLLVTVRLLVGLLLRIIQQPLDHVLNQTLDLRERVSSRRRSCLHRGADLRRQQRQRKVVALPAQRLQVVNDIAVILAACLGLHLQQAVRTVGGSASLLLNDLLSSVQSLQFLVPPLNTGLVVGSLHHAVRLQASQFTVIRVRVLRGLGEVTLSCGLVLLSRGLVVLGVVQLLVGVLDLVLQRRHQHSVGVSLLGLLLCGLALLSLGLLKHILKDFDHSIQPLVGLHHHVVLSILRALHERLQASPIAASNGPRLDQSLKSLRHAADGLSIGLRKARLLQSPNRPVDGVNGLRQLSVTRRVICVLLGPDLLGLCQVTLSSRDALGQLPNRSFIRLNIRG